jgi:F0F1-type ATP synthase membrane subunit b/b'
VEHVDTLMGVVLPYANFLIFLGLAIYFFRKPAAAAAAKRREDYLRLVNEAKKANDAAQAKLAELTRRQSQLDHEVREIQNLSKISAETEAKKIIEDAERLAVHLKAEAKRIADAEVEKAKAALRDEIIRTVHANVVDKVKNEMTADAQKSLVQRRIADLKSIPTQG